VRIALAGATVLAIAIGVPRLVPPVPLRAKSVVFTSEIDRSTLAPVDTLSSPVDPALLGGSLYLLVEVFSPSAMPTTVTLEWQLDGEVIRTTREIEITAHDIGFRVWDRWESLDGPLRNGEYRVVLRTGGERIFGMARIRVGG
jgi:hypothetical protein